MIKNIIFDLGGVIIDYNPEKALAKYFDEDDCRILLGCLFRNKLWTEMDRGVLTEEEALAAAKDKIPERYFEKVASIVHNWGDEMPPFEWMPDFIKALKDNGYGIYLLSNASYAFHEYSKKIPALSLFDGTVISADYHINKPDKGIYEALLNKYSLKAQECFFIDDVAANIEGAAAVGIAGHVHSHTDMPALCEALRRHGVNI